MQILAEKQHTPEWFRVKRGRVSASEAQKALMGRRTKGRRLYVAKLADDLEGLPDFDEVDVKPWFTDGIYYESWARGWYSFRYDVEVEQTGFVVNDDYSWIGCSPDGLMISRGGGVEFKFRKRLRTFDKMALTGVMNSVYAQLQTSIFVTGLDWWDYVNYWRSEDGNDFERGHRQRVYRDDAYINDTLLPAFVKLWHDVEIEVKHREVVRGRPF